jgi:acetyl-CoA acetyltransferase
MRDVYIIGVGETTFDFHKDDFDVLGRKASLEAMKHAGVDRKDIQSIYVGNAMNGICMAQRIFRDLGMCGGNMPISRIESACSAGAMAVHHSWFRIATGVDDVSLALGVENVSLHREKGTTGGPPEQDIEGFLGAVMPGKYAMRATRYMYETGATIEDLALVTVKNRKHATNNPYAKFKGNISVEEVVNSKMIAYPMTLHQSCGMTDAAAAVVLASEDAVKRLGISKPIKILASNIVTGPFSIGPKDECADDIVTLGVEAAYEQAGIGPEDIDMVELHDAFTISEILYYECMGFCKKGEGIKYLKDGDATHGGKCVFSPRGGMLANGHPIGASGAAQVVECSRQLWGLCDGYQVENAKTAMTQVTGGGVQGTQHAVATTHILSI